MQATYILMMFMVGCCFFIRDIRWLVVLILSTLFMAYFQGFLSLIGGFSLFTYSALVYVYFYKPSFNFGVRLLLFALLMAFTMAFFMHKIPGLYNYLALQAVQASAASSVFSMYLNLDKTMPAIVLFAMSGLLLKEKGMDSESIQATMAISAVCVVVLMTLSLLSGFVLLDVKFPQFFVIWALNNLFFVCFAEEVFFRGIVQNGLAEWLARFSKSPFIPIVLTALLFGVTHFAGGPIYMFLASIGGFFYGYAYYRTGRILSAMLVHFSLNLVHFLFFSYPYATSGS